jgi:outer membrane protein OmpA-like peptidoglycan-associated protein
MSNQLSWLKRSGLAAACCVAVAASGAIPARAQAPSPEPSIIDLQPRIVDLQPRTIDIAPKATQQGGQTQLNVESDVLFAFNSADLGPDAQAVLSQVVTRLKAAPPGPVMIIGYTDSIGDDAFNLDLSRRRATAVRDYLAQQVGRPELGYPTDGKGKADPVAPNTKPDGSDNPDGRRLNRRVTISFGQ